MSEATVTTVGSEKSAKKSRGTTKKTKTTKATGARTSSTKGKVGRPKKSTTTRKKSVDLEAFVALEEQIAANQKELLESISTTFQKTLNTQLKRADRRRRWNNFFRDLIIIVLMLALGYCGHLLYGLGYRLDGASLTNQEEAEQPESTEPIKDEAWYLANYSYLLDQTKTGLNADSVSAYYLYSNDYELSDIKPEYLLSMAYHQVAQDQATAAASGSEQPAEPTAKSSKEHIISITADDLKTKFTQLFGDTAKFYTGGFSAGCLNFVYQGASDTFEANNQTCTLNQHREIIERIERIYQEGEVMYVISSAGIYDKDEHSFYNFDDLFQPIAKNVTVADFENYQNKLNRYQYQFKKSDENFYFNKITKLD